MLTLITGKPGSFKTLMTVWDICRPVPGSTIEGPQGAPVPRTLYTNINELVVPHERIDAEDMNRWHEWAKPGDVIVFDEVQQVWRPRALGAKAPACIEALETHRHKGVDIVLVTQHPMLVDQNVRRLVNRHIDMRRLSVGMVYRYEWDHCSVNLQYRSALNAGIWRRPKAAFDLYKSAQLHTKTTARLPRVALLGLAGVVALMFLGPMAYGRLSGSLGVGGAKAAASGASAPRGVASAPVAAPLRAEPMLSARATASAQASGSEFGCMRVAYRCGCFDAQGRSIQVDDSVCLARVPEGPPAVDLQGTAFRSEVPVAVPMAAEDLALIGDMRKRVKR